MNSISNKLKNKVFLILGFCLLLYLYWPALFAQPMWDDFIFIFDPNSPAHLDFDSIFYTSWPFFYAVMAIMHKFFGNNYFGYHLISFLLHCFNAALTFYILDKQIGRKIAYVVSLFFLFHSMNYFDVSWIIQIKTLLSHACFLISVIFLFKYIESQNKINLVFSLFGWALSILSKSMLVPLPFILLALCFFKMIRVYLKFNRSIFIFLVALCMVSVWGYLSTTSGFKIAKIFNKNSTSTVILPRSVEKQIQIRNENIELMGLNRSYQLSSRVWNTSIIFGKNLINAVYSETPQFFPVSILSSSNQYTAVNFFFVTVTFLFIMAGIYFIYLKKYLHFSMLIIYTIMSIPFSHFLYIPLLGFVDYVQYWNYSFYPFVFVLFFLIVLSASNKKLVYILIGFLFLNQIMGMLQIRLIQSDRAQLMLGQHDLTSSESYLVLDTVAIAFLNQKNYQACLNVTNYLVEKFPNNIRLNYLQSDCERRYARLKLNAENSCKDDLVYLLRDITHSNSKVWTDE